LETEEKNRRKRGLEDVSHFFLSGSNPAPVSTEDPARQALPAPTDSGPGLKEELRPSVGIAGKGPVPLKVARPVEATAVDKTNLCKAAEEFLRSVSSLQFVAVDNIHSSKFGASDVMLFNQREMRVVCGRIHQHGKPADFPVRDVAYFAWLKECLTACTPLFNTGIDLAMYLFSNAFPPPSVQIVERLTGNMSVHLVQYHLLQVSEENGPAIYFQPLNPANRDPLDLRPKVDWDVMGVSKEEWQTFNRLKERSLTT
jgi:hypothetical protein